MGLHSDRGWLLYEQGRYAQAGLELRQELAIDPHNPGAHALLALCLSQQERYDDATHEAELAIHQGPEEPFSHYALAAVLTNRNRWKEAFAAIEEAIRLNPEDPDYFALLAVICMEQHQWAEALAAANQGLKFDAEHVSCDNLRAMSLVKLGRRQEAMTTLAATLAKDPDNATTHANQGWALLEQSQADNALAHFREALRLDPQYDWAQEGIVEALKARNVLYGWILRYFLWMGKLSGSTQFVVIIGGWFGFLFLLGVLGNNSILKPLALPLMILYLGFVFMTWTADSLFNLLLRLDRFGRLALSDEQIQSSNWVGGALLLAIAAFGVGLVTGNGLAIALSVGCLLLIFPLAGTFSCEKGWPRTAMSVYTGVMAVTGLLTLALVSAVSSGQGLPDAAIVPGVVFLLGAKFSGLVANALIMVRPQK